MRKKDVHRFGGAPFFFFFLSFLLYNIYIIMSNQVCWNEVEKNVQSLKSSAICMYIYIRLYILLSATVLGIYSDRDFVA